MKRHLSGAALAALIVAAPLRAETLADAIALAYRTNPTLESSRYAVRSADEGIVQAKAELRPTADLQLSGEFDRSVLGRTSASANLFGPPPQNKNRNQAAVSISQPIYTSGKASADRASAENGVRTAREALRGAEGDLLLSVIQAYVDVRRFQAALDVWHASILELEKIEKEIEARQEAGELTRTDIAQAETQLTQAQEQAVDTEQALEAARTDYRALVGRDPGLLSPEPALPLLPADVDTAFTMAERQSPELAQALYTEKASREDIASTKATGRPNVALRGSATLGGQAYPYHLYDQDQGFTGSLVVTIPLSAGGRIASQVRQAEDRNSQDRLKIEAARRELMRSITNAWNQMLTSDRAARLIATRASAAATQLDGTLSEYRVGLRSTFDVLYAQQTLRDAQVSALGTARDRYIAAATLLRRVGVLEPRALMSGVEVYDPSRHLMMVEGKNHVPWEGAVGALDHVAAARPREAILQQPPVSPSARLLPAATMSLAAKRLARTAPQTPIPGTTGRPSSPTGTSER